MSLVVNRWVLNRRLGRPLAKAVLYSLAHFADDEGYFATSIDCVERDAELDPRPTVWRTSTPQTAGGPDAAACCSLPDCALPGVPLIWSRLQRWHGFPRP